MSAESGVTPGAQEPAAPIVREVVPSDYEELKAFKSSVEAQLTPYWDVIQPILEDEDARTFTKSALETYNERKQKLEPALPPELEMFEKRLEGKFGGVVEYVNQQRQEREAAAEAKRKEEEAAQQATFQANKAYAERIMAERAEFRNADGGPSPMMEDLIILAAQRKMSVEDAYKEYGPRYFGIKLQSVPDPSIPEAAEPARPKRTPPTSLRGDAAAPGVPGESAAPRPTNNKERLARMKANIVAASAGGRGA